MSGTASASTRTAPSAPTPGVTASTIKVGYIYPDTENLPAGFTLPDTGSQVDQAKAFVDDLNQRGGINGRKVELKTYKFSLTADALADMRAQCLKATEDDKVFAVLTPSFFADPVLCVTQQHKTPMILEGGTTQEVIDKSKGLLYLTNFSDRRTRSSRPSIHSSRRRRSKARSSRCCSRTLPGSTPRSRTGS